MINWLKKINKKSRKLIILSINNGLWMIEMIKLRISWENNLRIKVFIYNILYGEKNKIDKFI